MANESRLIEGGLRSQCRSLRGDPAEADILDFIEAACAETFRQDAIRAWDNFQASGLYVTHAEADTWMAQLEAGVDIEPPVCHVKQKKADWSRNG